MDKMDNAKILFDMIEKYIEEEKAGASSLSWGITYERAVKILGEMEETAGKLMLACRDLKKEFGQHGKTN